MIMIRRGSEIIGEYFDANVRVTNRVLATHGEPMPTDVYIGDGKNFLNYDNYRIVKELKLDDESVSASKKRTG